MNGAKRVIKKGNIKITVPSENLVLALEERGFCVILKPTGETAHIESRELSDFQELIKSASVAWIDYIVDDFEKGAHPICRELGFSEQLVKIILKCPTSGYEDLEKEIKDTERIIQKATGKTARYFRPPKAWLTVQEKKKIEASSGEMEAALRKLSAERETLAQKVDKEYLSKYERILHSKDGLAMVSVEHDACGGCNINLPPQVINEIRMKEELIFCQSCARILYIEEENQDVAE